MSADTYGFKRNDEGRHHLPLLNADAQPGRESLAMADAMDASEAFATIIADSLNAGWRPNTEG